MDQQPINQSPDTSPAPVTVSQQPVQPIVRPRPALLAQLPVIIALLIIAGMLVVWKPWHSTNTNGRTITVTGTSKITADPDEYTFNPEYSSKGSDQAAALQASTTQTNAVVAKLKSLGVADDKIKTDTGGYRSYYDDTSSSYYAYLTITVDDKKLAQKVQDYLITTSPEGSVSPSADFSTSKRKQVESQARDAATKDARAKADQSAQNLGFKVGKVKSVQDDQDGGGRAYPLSASIASGANSAADSVASSPIQTGQNDLDYSVTVTYYVD